MSTPPVKRPGRRNLFKQKDVVRAMKSAEKGGLAIGHVEVVTTDGTTIRVFGSGTGKVPQNDWDKALTK